MSVGFVQPISRSGHDESRVFQDKQTLLSRYQAVRSFSEQLCRPLEIEDYVIQTMPDVSPTKWHLAHTSWFFEAFILASLAPDYSPLHPRYHYLYNSYYLAMGERHCRPRRGLLSRPTVAETYTYRGYVDEHMLELIEHADEETLERLAPLVTIGIHHEQQHQELMLTDIKHVFGSNPLRPAYLERDSGQGGAEPPALSWLSYPEGIYSIGHQDAGFSYDNEGPAHRQLVHDFELAARLVTNGEYLAFIDAGGYQRPDLWLSAGAAAVEDGGWQTPLYWEKHDGRWYEFTLAGLRELDHSEPVCHLSYYEADAYARWAGARLPSEFEWEVAATNVPISGTFADSGRFHPAPLRENPSPGQPAQLYGDVWQWMRSSYEPYPGFRSAEGALGEYNGKFMCNQYVLRGASCATSQSHARRTYRNFFPADARWQFMGIRLARDVV